MSGVGSLTSGGGGGDLTADNIANFLGKAKKAREMKGRDVGVVWQSDPAKIMGKMIKGGQGSGRGEREERIKKRREELLNMLT